MIGYLFTNVATDEDKINLVWKKALKIIIIEESLHQESNRIENRYNQRIRASIIEIESYPCWNTPSVCQLL